eukprot:gene4291-7647_t
MRKTLTKQQVAEIFSEFSIDEEIQELKLIPAGWENHNYSVMTTKKLYFLKHMIYKPVEDINLFLNVVDQLKKYDFPTSYPFKTKNGQFLIQYKGMNMILFEFLNGKSPEKLSEKMISQIGHSLAILHSLPRMEQKFPHYQMGYESITSFMNDHHQNEKSPFADHEFVKFVSQKITEINRVKKLNLPTGIIHGDLFIDNTIFKDEKLLGIIDFEDLSQMELIYDIAMTILGNCFNEFKIDLNLVKSFIDEYQKVRKLTQDEINSLPVCIRWTATSIGIWRFKKFNITDYDEKHKDRYVIMMKICENLNDEEILKAIK